MPASSSAKPFVHHDDEGWVSIQRNDALSILSAKPLVRYDGEDWDRQNDRGKCMGIEKHLNSLAAESKTLKSRHKIAFLFQN
eukprot:11751032-Ditylum_brightwellii.AAC.1